MVSLSYRGVNNYLVGQTSIPHKERFYSCQRIGYDQEEFRDFCGDCPNKSSVVDKIKKNSKGRKEKRFQPFRAFASPCQRNTSQIPFITSVQIPRDDAFVSAGRKQPDFVLKTAKTTESTRFIVKTREMKEFFKLTDDPVIQDFLNRDSCKRIADKYLIAMVFAYFKRADFSIREYTRLNFFIGLYLANDLEEDEEEIKYEIFPWILGENWKNKYPAFLKMRDALFRQIDYKAIISRRCCDEIMAIEPDSVLWKRERPIYHGGAVRSYMRDPEDDGYPRGPDGSPRYCPECDPSDSQYDSASPASTSWCISSSSSSSDGDDLVETLPLSSDVDDVWPTVEE